MNKNNSKEIDFIILLNYQYLDDIPYPKHEKINPFMPVTAKIIMNILVISL